MSSTSADAAAAWEEWINLVTQNHNANYAYATALTFLAYDIVLSFGEEVKYVWGSKWSIVKGLYILVRYCSLLNLVPMVAFFTQVNYLLSIAACKNYFFWSVIAGPPLFIITLDVILMLRVWALYGRNKTLLIVLSVLILADFVAALWATTKYAGDLAAQVMSMPYPWRGCVSTIPHTESVLVIYVPNFVLSCLFLVMTLWKLVQNQELYGNLSWENLRKVKVMSPLLLAFVRDGSWFFALACIATLLGLMGAIFIKGIYSCMLYPWTIALYSYSGAHLILNLRAVKAEDGSPTDWSDLQTLNYSLNQPRAIIFT